MRRLQILVAVAMVAGVVGAIVPALPAAATVPDNINQTFITGASTPFGVVVNATNIFWANTGNGTIGEANLDGSDPTTLITGASTPSGLVVDSTYIYWANQTGNECIGRADLNGTNVNQCFINADNGGYGPIGLAVDANYIYWTTGYFDTVGRANLDGTDPDQTFIVPAGTKGSDALTGLAVNTTYIFWADETTDTISRANIADGSDVVSPFISGTNSGGVVLDANANYIYWANVSDGTIGRANIDGSGVNPSFISGASSPVGVWVGPDYIYWANSGSSTIGRANLVDVPDAPTIGTATPGAGSGSVSFTFTGDDNGSPISSYTATCTSTSGATGTASGSSSPIVVSGLTNGAPYTCTVTATNGFGTSMPSAPSNMFTPVAVPAAPTIGPGAAAGVGSAVVSFTAPPSNGGSPILSYTATCFSLDGEPTMSATGTGSPITVTGLVAATPYECSVTATNAVGTGPPSGLSNMFGLPGASRCTTVPSAPLTLSQAPGNSSAVVSWAPPLTGATCVAGYVVTPYVGPTAQSPVLIPGQGTTTVVSGLTNGLTYTFTVTAENGLLEGPPSTMSGPVLAGAPAAATALHVTKVLEHCAQDQLPGARQQRCADHQVLGDLQVDEWWRRPDELGQGRAAHRDRSERRQGVHVHRQSHQQPWDWAGIPRVRDHQGVRARARHDLPPTPIPAAGRDLTRSSDDPNRRSAHVRALRWAPAIREGDRFPTADVVLPVTTVGSASSATRSTRSRCATRLRFELLDYNDTRAPTLVPMRGDVAGGGAVRRRSLRATYSTW